MIGRKEDQRFVLGQFLFSLWCRVDEGQKALMTSDQSLFDFVLVISNANGFLPAPPPSQQGQRGTSGPDIGGQSKSSIIVIVKQQQKEHPKCHIASRP